MGAIRKRGKGWQIDYVDPLGKRIRKTFGKKKEAEAEIGKRVSLMAEGRYLDVRKDYTATLSDLLVKYSENFSEQSTFRIWKRVCFERFKEYFGTETLLANIRYVDCETYRNQLRQRLTARGTIRTDASVNREISCLHHIFAKAVEWELVERSPFDRGKSLLLKENNKRLRFLDDEEITRLLETCPVHLKEIVTCALNTGMRRGEILSLKWEQIRNGFIYLRKTKTNEPRQIPINEALEQLFKSIRQRQQLRSEYVFTFVNCGDALKSHERNLKHLNLRKLAGNPIDNVKTGFKAACKRAGIEDFRFHDLRHTFASQMILKGASLKVVQEILGHKTMTMTLRYAHLSQEHKREAVNLLNNLTSCHKMSQNSLLDKKRESVISLTP